MALLRKIKAKLQYEKNQQLIRSMRGKLKNRDLSIISQNCIGGVFSHDMGLEFRSPTVNLFIKEPDFVKFVQDLKRYLSLPLQMRWGESYPIGQLDDIEVHFMHYETCQDASDAWERRKRRVNWDNILVLATDRNGFDDEVFAQWQKIDYPKVLFTVQKKYKDIPGSVFFPKYSKQGIVPDLIPNREFYKDGILMDIANRMEGAQDDSAGK